MDSHTCKWYIVMSYSIVGLTVIGNQTQDPGTLLVVFFT